MKRNTFNKEKDDFLKERNEELKQAGGYTRKYLKGERRGDAAEVAIVELV